MLMVWDVLPTLHLFISRISQRQFCANVYLHEVEKKIVIKRKIKKDIQYQRKQTLCP